MRAINIFQFDAPSMEEQPVEFVERKGRGHPDSMIDGIMERASIDLCKYYTEEFGLILHHNVDKGLIIGGSSVATFGKGKITRPIEIILTGRATNEYDGRRIPVDDIAIKAAKAHITENTRFLDLKNEVKVSSKIVRGSADLNQVFARSTEMPLANDTSFGVGFAPLTDAEQMALQVERMLNSAAYKKKMPAVGEDIKVMSVREKDSVSLNIAIAFVAKFIGDIDEYVGYKERVIADVAALCRKITKKDVTVTVNSGDLLEQEEVYLTKSGLSMEAGDDGSVGRGNRPNGLITPMRYMSMEAAAGKNPVNHTGKIYSIVAREMAAEIVKQYPQIKECDVAMVSHIGRRIDDPKNLSIKVYMNKGEKLEPIRSKVQGLADEMLSNMGYITQQIALGKYEVY